MQEFSAQLEQLVRSQLYRDRYTNAANPVSSEEQKFFFLILIKSSLSFAFNCMISACWVLFKTSLPNPKSQRFPPIISFRSLYTQNLQTNLKHIHKEKRRQK